MKTQLAASPIFTQGINSNQVSAMDMDLEGMKQACQIFRDNIYTDKVLAVVREWTCNAIDEHVKHKIQKPVQAGVADQRFFVRDFAQGLDDNGIRNVFGKYFRSTKSNSDEPIGGFGVGAKAGHCYNDVFYVTSFHNGTKTVYSCVLGGDETGASIGQVIEMSQEPTTESGLLVEIEVKAADEHKFIDNVEKMATLVNSCTIEVVSARVPMKVDKKLIHQEAGISIYHIATGYIKEAFVITMGGVAYKTPDSFLGFSFGGKVKPKGCIQIDVPIGFFDIPISRESFRDTFKFKDGIEVCERIVNHLIDIEKAKITNTSLIDLIYNASFESDVFTFYRSSFIQGEIALLLARFAVQGTNTDPLYEIKGKVVVATLSNSNQHYDRQESELLDFCLDKSIRIISGSVDSCNALIDAFAKHKIDSGFVFRPVRSVLPKKVLGATFDGKHSVYRRGYGRNMRLTALELHNLWTQRNDTADEARQFNKEYFENANLSNLARIAICENGFTQSYSFKSLGLKKELLALGYVLDNSSEYDTRHKELLAQYQEMEKTRQMLRPMFYNCKRFLSAKTRNILDHAISFNNKAPSENLTKRLAQIKNIITQKQNHPHPAVKILFKCIEKNQYMTLDRAEIREIMNSAK
jgi:hypothetical protein